MSEWNYTSCSKPFDSVEEALEFMQARKFSGQVLKRTEEYTAVCPTYPEGYYPDAVSVASYAPESGVTLAADEGEATADCCGSCC
ncbi:MAG: hypothetical protein QGG57_02725 [Candidatus Poseidoniia archaeon]|jgi:hypothetical protein|nr:hypothetical protein [Candidatus Poseidoniia archaeon]